MQPLEITILLLNALLLVGCLTGRRLAAWWKFLPVVTLTVVVFHLVIGGARWHMAFGYLVSVWLFITFTWPCMPAPGRWAALLGVGMLAGAFTVGMVLPVFKLPQPTGPYQIGTVTRHLIDSARRETQGPNAGGRRELMIQLWYPADQQGPKKTYRSRAETTSIKAHLALVRTHASTGVPVAEALERYPVLLFSPSWIGRRNQNTVQAEELASHGFVVVGVDHPYGSDLSIFPDGRQARTILGDALDFATDESLRTSLQAVETQLLIRAADVRFVLDELERQNQSDPEDLLTGRLDLERVGVFGHSFGGAVAAEVCRSDARFRAGANLDGFIYGRPTKEAVGKPFLFISDSAPNPMPERSAASDDPARRRLTFGADNAECICRSMAGAGGIWLTIRGASHMNFCDSPLYTPIKRLTGAGSIRPERAMQIVNAYLVAFFNLHLGVNSGSLVNAPNPPYPEVAVERLLPAEH